MQNIKIFSDNGVVKVFINGIQLTGLHSFSLDYVKGAPILFSCVADVGEKKADGAAMLH